jgi:hypothetical protein
MKKVDFNENMPNSCTTNFHSVFIANQEPSIADKLMNSNSKFGFENNNNNSYKFQINQETKLRSTKYKEYNNKSSNEKSINVTNENNDYDSNNEKLLKEEI